MNFKEWLRLQETGTSTADVAMFKSPIFAEPFRRPNLGVWGEEDPFFRKKRRQKMNEAKLPPPTIWVDCPGCKGSGYEKIPELKAKTGHDTFICNWCGGKGKVSSTSVIHKIFKKNEHGLDPTAYGSSLGSDPHGQSLPSSPLTAKSSMAQTLPQGDQPTLLMPIKLMKRKMKKSS